MGMATKNISITEEAYDRLANLRKKNESFSEIIIEITGNANLMDFFGVLSEESGKRLEKTIKIMREKEKKIQVKKIREIFAR